ncbi:hypothetical protein [Poseidonocella sp. HB161398]|uniref:GTA head formation protein, RCAP_rcc01685 family n=1 Tax=Poseidonocella sp. HB161398 TaxID=2320855 RepID=UPI001F0FFEEA|nr:hypothetical protein [Poseidonocella sp. HB161398]
MADLKRMPQGSRFLFEPFQYGPKEFQEAQEKILEMKFAAVDMRLERIEVLIERMERRLWLTVYGVTATILAQAAKTLLTMTPTGGP